MIVTTINKIDETHIAEVMDEMRTLGAPVIRVAESFCGFIALEGSHRLEAAKRLGIEPIIDVLDMDDEIDNPGFPDLDNRAYMVAEIVEFIGAPEGAAYDTDEDFIE